MNTDQIIAYTLQTRPPFREPLQTTQPTPELKDKIMWGYNFSVPEDNTVTLRKILTLKQLHEEGYTTFAYILLSLSNLVEAYGRFNAIRPYSNIIYFYSRQKLVTSELRLLIDNVRDYIDNSTNIYFSNDLLLQANIPNI